MDAVDLPANGITLCTGSLGARPDNDLPGMMRRLGDRVHFLHLRNVTIEGDQIRNSFHEAMHLEGGTDMVAVIAAVLAEERRRRAAGRADCSIPIRPDHGQDILDDLGRKGQPGYPAIGRMRGLAELRGIMTALDHPSGHSVPPGGLEDQHASGQNDVRHHYRAFFPSRHAMPLIRVLGGFSGIWA
jgi:mannonate dehydratase